MFKPKRVAKPGGVHAFAERKPEAWLLRRLHLLCRFSDPPHTAKRDPYDLTCAPDGRASGSVNVQLLN